MKIQPRELEKDYSNLQQYSLTVTATNWTTLYATGTPYKTLNGIWRLKFSISGTLSSADNSDVITIQGVTFKREGEPCIMVDLGGSYTLQRCVTYANTSTFVYVMGGSAGTFGYSICGDLELTGKPAWIEG